MLVTLVSQTSPLYPRCLRLSLFWLGLLADLACSALFFNLQGEDTLFESFWATVLENMWVALYSSILATFTLLLPALALRVPTRLFSNLKALHSDSEKALALKRIRKKLCCYRAVGLACFGLLSGLLGLYLLAFCQVASGDTALAWLSTSLLSIFCDLFVLELLAVFLYGGILTLSVLGECPCCLCLVVTLSFYRVIRNLLL